MSAEGEQETEAPNEAGSNPRADVETEGATDVEELPEARPVNPRSIPKEPEWADQRAMLNEHPRWALATMALLVVGLVTGYVSLAVVGPSLMHKCTALADVHVCDPRTQGVVLALPVLALGLGLAISWLGGRRLAKRGRRAVVAAWVGWTVFVLTAVICYGVVGGHA